VPDDRPLAGRHAVITGASRGIGAAAAEALARLGARVTLMGRDEDALRTVSGKIAGSKVVVCDVTETASVSRAFAEAREHGPIAILVNNAGIAASAPFLRTDDALIERIFAVNVMAAFRCARTVLPGMLAGGWGRIVNVASVAGLKGYRYISAYTASKHALVGMTRALASEVADKNITVNAVCPSYVDTEMTRQTIANIVAKTGRSETDALAELVRGNPQGRLIAPEEVAHAIAWLCAPGAESITGQAIPIAGGEIM
jgi:NAD(P)-dependent dehydrogenase (short-subunit alcohol dehydrogenase family)